jgi:hypothetical protein
MLKFIYTETDSYLELVGMSMHEWVDRYQRLAEILGDETTIDRCCRYSFLVPIEIMELERKLILNNDRTATVTVDRCDAGYMEIQMDGCWVSTHLGSEEGVFLTQLPPESEEYVWQIWHAAKSYSR